MSNNTLCGFDSRKREEEEDEKKHAQDMKKYLRKQKKTGHRLKNGEGEIVSPKLNSVVVSWGN